MLQSQSSLISEVESAIAADKRVAALRRIADLFMVHADEYSDDQLEVFGDVIGRLAEQIEAKARAELARRLAPVSRAPVAVIRKFALDRSMDVAEPVLRQSPRLTEENLLSVAQTEGQDRLLTISKRATVSEAISDVLMTRGNQEVVRSVVCNEGARFSNAGFGKLVERSADDDDLAITLGLRKDMPKEHFWTLIAKASDAVFKKLSADNPAAAGNSTAG